MARKTKRVQRLEALAEVADEFEGWEQGREVLTPVRSVPTIFPQFDVATRVKGYPIQRVCMVHGPSNHGKTVFMLGLGRSFLEREHFYFHVDAELSTPEPWVVENLAACADYGSFRAMRPKNYEEVALGIRKACGKLNKLKASGAIPPDTSALFGVDSLQKLIPADFMAKLQKKGGIDAGSGRGGQIQAMLNSAWMKELVPLMYHCNAGLLLLSREAENVDAGAFEVTYKVGGGKAPYYDSSLVCRITRNGWVEVGSKENKVIIGERHLVQIMKTKVGHKDAKITRCFFHTSNGKHIPAGFDTARDVIELGVDCGVLKKEGTNIIDINTGEVLGATTNAAVLLLNDHDPRSLRDLQERVLAKAKPVEEEAVAE